MLINDTFNRSVLNPVWSKSGGNPEIGTDNGDPFLWYESGTYYLFVAVAGVGGNIVCYTSTDLTTWSGPTTKLSVGTSAWDDYKIEGPFIVKAGNTYYMFYGGNITSGGSGTTWKIGYATSSSINGTYTKYASNPIISRAGSGKGVNDNSILYNAPGGVPLWQLYCTSGSSGNIDDVADGDVARFTASTPSGTWTDQGNVITNPGQDTTITLDGTTVLMDYTPTGAQEVKRYVSSDNGVTFTQYSTTTMLTRVASTWENFIYAPSIATDGSTYAMAYQGQTTGTFVSSIGIATNSTLHRWIANVADGYNMPSSYLHTTTPSPMDFTNCRSEYPFAPPYTLQCDFYSESQADSGIFTLGWHVAKSASLYYQVFVNAAAGRIYSYSSSGLSSDTQLHTSSALTINPATWYSIRVNVTATGYTVDFYNGSWNTGILTETGLTLVTTRVGMVSYSPANNLSRYRNFTLTGVDHPITGLTGSYALTGTASIFRIGSLTWLRYRK